MAVLGRIRDNAAMLVIVIAVALGAFIIGDALRSGTTWFAASKRVALEIDGEKVPIEAYSARLHSREEQMKGRGQQLSDEQRMMLNNQVAQEYVANYAMNKLAEEVGVAVSPEEVYAFITGTDVPASPVAQQFFSQFGIDVKNTEAVNSFIEQMKQYATLSPKEQAQVHSVHSQWLELQKNIKSSRLQAKMASLLSRSYKLTKLDEELTASASRQVALVRSSASLISDSTSRATDEEIKKYYEEHKDFFRTQSPSAEVNLISVQVAPSAEDYQAYASEVDALYENLLTTTGRASLDLLRNYSNKFTNKAFLTVAELDQMGIGADEVEFIKTKSVGDVYKSALINDRYNVLKLTAKKTAPASIGMRIMILDSAMSAKSDSLVTALAKGAKFADLAKQYNQDPTLAQNGGLVKVPNRMGQVDSTFSELQLAQMGLDTLYHTRIGSVITLDRGQNKMLVKAVEPKASVEKYQILYASIPVEFSDKTYNDKYAALNTILGADTSFEKKMEEARKAGFNVVEKVSVSTETPQIAGIASSRSIISWAMEAEDGAVAEKLYRCGTENLAIAQVVKHYPKGFAPLARVRSQIKARLEADKHAEKMVKELEADKLTTLDAYATKLNTKVDTLVAVNYDVRGMEGAKFNGVAMTTAIGQLSKPFASNQQVMVVQPIAQKAVDAESQKAQAKQKEADLGRQVSYRSFANLLQSIEVEDNRTRFY